MKYLFFRVLGAARLGLLALLLASAPAWAATASVSYVDAGGNPQGPVTATILDGTETSLSSGRYITDCTSGPLSYTQTIVVGGTNNANLILADNCAMSVTFTPGLNEPGIWIQTGSSLTVYAQSTGASMGSLTA